MDGRIAKLGDSADPAVQVITVDNKKLKLPEAHTYVILNKPRGVVATLSDPEGRRTVRDLVPLPQRIYPVGRLDVDSEGLLLLTDDGDLTQHLTHPRYEHPRIYRALVAGKPTSEDLARWKRGIELDGHFTRCDNVKIDNTTPEGTWLTFVVHEGRYHLIRRLTEALGYPTLRLIRVGMGGLRLGDLPPGQWRYLTNEEILALERQTGLRLKPGVVAEPVPEKKPAATQSKPAESQAAQKPERPSREEKPRRTASPAPERRPAPDRTSRPSRSKGGK